MGTTTVESTGTALQYVRFTTISGLKWRQLNRKLAFPWAKRGTLVSIQYFVWGLFFTKTKHTRQTQAFFVATVQ